MNKETNWERYFGTPKKVVEYFVNNKFDNFDRDECFPCPMAIDGRCFAFEGSCMQRLIQWLESDTETNELKPCPFCGGRWQHTELSTEGISCVRHVCTITCAFCGCQMSFNSYSPEAAEGFAVEAWNTRA